MESYILCLLCLYLYWSSMHGVYVQYLPIRRACFHVSNVTCPPHNTCNEMKLWDLQSLLFISATYNQGYTLYTPYYQLSSIIYANFTPTRGSNSCNISIECKPPEDLWPQKRKLFFRFIFCYIKFSAKKFMINEAENCLKF